MKLPYMYLLAKSSHDDIKRALMYINWIFWYRTLWFLCTKNFSVTAVVNEREMQSRKLHYNWF